MHKMLSISDFLMGKGVIEKIFLIYLTIISLISIVVTIYDKKTAQRNGGNKRKKQRVSEAALIIISLLGGSLSMLLTMFIIRHKTTKIKFMLGIPIIIFLQVIIILFLRNGVLGK